MAEFLNEENKNRRTEQMKVPKFKSKTVKVIEDPLQKLPTVNTSIFKYYDLESDKDDIMNKQPYIVYLKEEKVEAATNKQRTEFVRSVGRLSLKILLFVVLGVLIVSGIALGIKHFRS